MKPLLLGLSTYCLSVLLAVNASAFDMGAFEYVDHPAIMLDADGRQKAYKLYPGQVFSLNLELDAGAQANANAEWWLVAVVGGNFWSYQSPTDSWSDGVWREGLHRAFQKTAQNMVRQEIMRVSLPPGVIDLYVGVDTQVDNAFSPNIRYDHLRLEVANTAHRTYHVSTSGNDNNPGTAAQPWRTGNKAGSTARAGDLVLFRAGTYREQFDIVNSGTAAHPIVFAAAPGETVIFNGNSLSLRKPADAPFAGVINAQGVNHVWIMGFQVRNSPEAGIMTNQGTGTVVQNNLVYNASDAGIAVWESSHFVVDGNEIELANNGGSTEQENLSIGLNANNFEVRYNYVHNGGDTRGHDGISIKDGSYNGKVHHNYVHDIENNSCMYMDGWDSSLRNIEVYSNRFHHCPWHGLSIASERGGEVSDIKIYNNVFSENGYIESNSVIGMGIHVGAGYTFPMRNIEIYNNTFYNNGPGSAYSGSLVLRNRDGDGITVRNNIFASDDFQVQIINRHTPSNVTIHNNLFSKEDKTFGNGETQGDNAVIADPLFVNPDGGDFRLQAASPAINAGHASSQPALDARSQIR